MISDLRARSFGKFRNILISRLFCSWEQNRRNGKSKYSGMRIAPKQTLTRIIPLVLIPD